jgi:hypothetical protein
VITNAGLICFTMTVIDRFSLQGRVWIFLGFQWVLISLQYILQAVIDDVPEEVEIQLKRTQFINEKVIEHVEDEDFDTQVEVLFEVEDADNDEQVVKGCCGRKKGKSSMRGITNVETDFPYFEYPFNNQDPANDKPAPYHRDHPDLLTKASEYVPLAQAPQSGGAFVSVLHGNRNNQEFPPMPPAYGDEPKYD